MAGTDGQDVTGAGASGNIVVVGDSAFDERLRHLLVDFTADGSWQVTTVASPGLVADALIPADATMVLVQWPLPRLQAGRPHPPLPRGFVAVGEYPRAAQVVQAMHSGARDFIDLSECRLTPLAETLQGYLKPRTTSGSPAAALATRDGQAGGGAQPSTSQEMYARLLDPATHWFFTLSGDGTVVDSSPSSGAVCGRSAEELSGRALSTLFQADQAMTCDTAIRDVLAGKQESVALELRLATPTEPPTLLNLVLTPIRGRDGSGLVGIAQNLHDRSSLEHHLFSLYRAVEQATDSVVITDADGIVEYVNPAYERTTGFSAAEALGRRPGIISNGVRPTGVHQSIWTALKGGNAWAGRLEHQARDGGALVEDLTISPVRNDAGEVTAFFARQRDASDQVRAEDLHMQTEKMRAVGQLAGGIAHDFNNQLTVIQGFVQMLQRKLPANDPLRGYCDTILKACTGATTLTQQLLSFARRGKSLTTPTNLNRVVKEVEAVVRQDLDPRIRIETTFAVEPAIIDGDPAQLKSAILNLASNARDAMPDGGVLRFAITSQWLDAITVQHLSPDLAIGEYIVLSVEDTGTGMDALTLGRIFEPFFTTKSKGKGTGMGLAAVYGTVRNHNGCVKTESTPDVGTVCRLYLPRSGKTEDQSDKAHSTVIVAPTSHRTVLVLDDEENVRMIASSMLQELGYKVVQFGTGRETVEWFRTHHAEVHAVMLDMVMPEMNGREVYMELRVIQPTVRVLVTSGFSLSGDVQATLDAGARGFLQKPYKLTTLSRHLTAVLT